MPAEANRGNPTGQVLIDLALQGGGAHGAFTWGVLDRVLEEPRLRIDGISGTSAGAMNAAVLVDGYEQGGPDGARTALEAVNLPLGEAVSSEADRVREASARLSELQSLIQTELISALGLSLNFNDNDGD